MIDLNLRTWHIHLVATFGAILVASCGGSAPATHADGQGNLQKGDLPARQQVTSDEHFLRCFETVRSQYVEADVKTDAARGERRFIYINGWEGMTWEPLGIGSCSKSAGKPDERRRVVIAGYSSPPSGYSTPPGDACGIAILNYIGEYNQAMARLFPTSLPENCPSKRAKIDGAYRPTDLIKLAQRLHLRRPASN